MNHKASESSDLPEFDSGGANDFNVVVAYDTRQAAGRAMRWIDSLVEQFGDELSVHRNLWRFDILSLPAVQEAARADAANANLVVIATDGDADLPAAVKASLNGWVASSTPDTTALVALRWAAGGYSPISHFLQTAARNASQDLFVREFVVPLPAGRLSIEDVQRRAEATSTLLLGILEHNQPPHHSPGGLSARN